MNRTRPYRSVKGWKDSRVLYFVAELIPRSFILCLYLYNATQQITKDSYEIGKWNSIQFNDTK